MKHLKKGRKFGRPADYRASFLKNLGNSLILKGRIRTTLARAKELRGVVEPAITRAKKDNLNSRRLLYRRFSPEAVKKLFGEAAAYQNRPGGYTRILKLGQRKNDGAQMAIIELVK